MPAKKTPSLPTPVDREADAVIIDITVDDLTINEVEQFETIIGGPIESAFGSGAKRGVVTRAMAYLYLRRQDPTITMKEVGEMRFTSIRHAQMLERDE